jgi:hypothetical protein
MIDPGLTLDPREDGSAEDGSAETAPLGPVATSDGPTPARAG